MLAQEIPLMCSFLWFDFRLVKLVKEGDKLQLKVLQQKGIYKYNNHQ